MSWSSEHPASQCNGSTSGLHTDLANHVLTDTPSSATLCRLEPTSQQRTESLSSLSTSSSSSTCSKDEKVEMTCSVKDCNKSAFKSRKCKYHNNKTYKETYKRRKARANQDYLGVGPSSLDSHSDRKSIGPRHKLGEEGSMLEQVLNEKKLALMQSPIVLDFLQKQQRKKYQQQKHQQKQWGLQQVRGYGHPQHP